MNYYTGIGSRTTPQAVLESMKFIAANLEQQGYILRSGGAKGADTAFAQGVAVTDMKQIYYPKPDHYDVELWEAAKALAVLHHPAPDVLYHKPFIMNLMARNSFQVMGADLRTPSEFVICWTPDGAYAGTQRKTGGTGQAIRIALYHSIPVYNLAQPTHLDEIMDVLS